MKVVLVTDDPEFGAAFAEACIRARPGLQVERVAHGGTVPPAALLVVEGDGVVPSGYAASRWRLDRRNDPTDLQSPTAAAVDVERVAWPCADAHLRHKLDEVVQRVHEMTGILPPDLLHRAMLRVMELASESIEVTDTSVRLLHVNPAIVY